MIPRVCIARFPRFSLFTIHGFAGARNNRIGEGKNAIKEREAGRGKKIRANVEGMREREVKNKTDRTRITKRRDQIDR